MPDGIDVGFPQTGHLFIEIESALSVHIVASDRHERRDPCPLILIEHRHLYAAAPAM